MARPKVEDLQSRERVYDFIIGYKSAADGVAPTYDEIRQETGFGLSHIKFILDTLEEEGRIVRETGPRNIRVPGAKWTGPAEAGKCG